MVALLLAGGTASAQTPLGQWQLVAPGTSASRLVEANNALYVAGDYGLFRYDLADKSIRALSKQDGFADVRVAALAYDSATRLVVIGYQDTNIDLLDPRTGVITNVADIQRRTIVGTKAISAITTIDGLAYVACSFGIVVVDLRKVEVADTYSGLGRTGNNVAIRAVAVRGDSLLAAIDNGVLVGLRTRNLLDYRNWTLNSTLSNVGALAVYRGHFYAANDGRGVFRLNADVWDTVAGISATSFVPVTGLMATRTALTVVYSNDSRVSVLRADGSVTDLNVGAGLLLQALIGSDGQYYIADQARGLLVTDAARLASGTPPAIVAPNGPAADVSFFTLPVGADMYAFSGGYNSGTGGTGRGQGFSHRQGGQWRTYNRSTVSPATNYPDLADNLSAAAWNPVNQKLYIGSYGNGLIEWSGPDAPFRRFSGAPLVSTTGIGEGYYRVPGVAVDAAGIVWFTNFHQAAGQPSLFSFDPATAIVRPHLAGVVGAEMAQRIVIDDNGNKWIAGFPSRVKGTGILGLVYNEQSGRSRPLTVQPENGGLVGEIYAIAKDRKGDIWIGTSKGVQVFYNTADALTVGATFKAVQPIIDRRFLLENQLVKAIAIDGANRKWIGTDDGVYLFGEDGDVAIAQFTAENSPLPSNVVNSLSINGVTGEVFIGTDGGLVSYRGSATEPPTTEEKPTCTTVFPNPVPARFAGQIAIDGLTGGATVKITDVAGQLVYEATATGGRAVWNARDYNGRRVRTGIYLAYSSDADGQNTCVSKIAVLGE